MANNSLNISIPLKFEVRTPPRGMTDYDPKTLSSEQQRELNVQKTNIRKENILYLAEHPEVKALVSLITRKAMIKQPRDVIEFIANFFTRPADAIEKEVLQILNESKVEYSPIPFDTHEHWDY